MKYHEAASLVSNTMDAMARGFDGTKGALACITSLTEGAEED